MQTEFRELVEERCEYLETLKSQLDLYADPLQPETQQPSAMLHPGPRENIIFIVHGHQEAPKCAIADFLRDFTNLEPPILHELPKGSRAIIEILETVGSNVGFAIVLLTPSHFS